MPCPFRMEFSMFQVRRVAVHRLMVGALVTLVTLALAGCGGAGGGDVTPPPKGKGELQPVSAPGEFVNKVKALVIARRLQGALGVPVATAPTTGATPGAAGAPAYSSTTRQEDAVDEDDLIKTDGTSIYSYKTTLANGAQRSSLQVDRRASDGSLAGVQTLALSPGEGYETVQGMQLSLSARRLASLRRGASYASFPCPANTPCAAPAIVTGAATTTLDLMTVRSDGSLESGSNAVLQGDLVASRMVGTTMLLVTTHRPGLLAETSATPAERDAALATMTAADILPSVRLNGAQAQPLVTETQCYVQPDNGSLALEVTTITAIDMASPGFAATSRCFLGGAEAVYVSPTKVYLATARWPQPKQDGAGRWVYPTLADLSTDIHKFSLDASTITYRATGSVVGHLGWERDRTAYRMGEHQGDLRVVTFTGTSGWALPADAASGVAPSPATLTVLREDATERQLKAVATLPNSTRPAPIGLPGEQVYAVRFAGDRAYVVTFRRTDPLYVLDLSNPADPRQAGELKITGFSNALFPLPNGLLLGVGKDADAQGIVKGVKVALFDVANASQPTVLNERIFGGAGSTTALDASTHGISLFTVGDVTRLGLPMALRSDSSNGSTAPAEHSLQRLSINAQARTMTLLSPLGPKPSSAFVDLSADRSLHIGDTIYWYSDGEISAYAW